MNPSVLLVPRLRFRKELVVVGVVLVSVIGLPVMALATMTNIPALAADSTISLFTGQTSKDNLYDYGYCTFWAAKRREETGKPIPNNWGNANTWDDRALAAGYLVDHIPAVGAIMQTDAGPLGHVAFVESVAPDGSWTISEMNYKGWDILSDRTLNAADAKNYNFIH